MAKNYEHRETIHKVVIRYDAGGYDPCGRSDDDYAVEKFKKKEDALARLEELKKTRNFVCEKMLYDNVRYVLGAYVETTTKTRVSSF